MFVYRVFTLEMKQEKPAFLPAFPQTNSLCLVLEYK